MYSFFCITATLLHLLVGGEAFTLQLDFYGKDIDQTFLQIFFLLSDKLDIEQDTAMIG